MQGHSVRQPATSRPQARFAPTLKHPKLSFMGMTGQQAMGWVPILGVWGVGVGALATLYLSDIPKFKNDVLLKIPVLREYYVDRTPDSDKPF